MVSVTGSLAHFAEDETTAAVLLEQRAAFTVDGGLTRGFSWVSSTSFAEWCEKLGKFNIIDTFTRNGCRGLHRAGDKLHDPLVGFFFSLEELGPVKTVKTWIPHMLADVWTDMSLPLPFTWAVSSDHWWHQLYRRGYNVKTAALGPVVAVGLTEIVVRSDVIARLLGTHDDDRDVEKELLVAHSVNATVSGAAILAAKSLGLTASALATYDVVLLASGVLVVVYAVKISRRQEVRAGLRRLRPEWRRDMEIGATTAAA
jgi:hypothetical protein